MRVVRLLPMYCRCMNWRVTVTVQNGNIVAYVNQAVERNSRKN